jgi:hypothetical protein
VNDLEPIGRQTAIITLEAAGAYQIPFIVGELYQPNAQMPECSQRSEPIIFQGCTVLESQDHSDLALMLGTMDIINIANDEKPIRLRFGEPPVCDHVVQGGPERGTFTSQREYSCGQSALLGTCGVWLTVSDDRGMRERTAESHVHNYCPSVQLLCSLVLIFARVDHIFIPFLVRQAAE